MKYAFLLTLASLAPVAGAQVGLEQSHARPVEETAVAYTRELRIDAVSPMLAMAPDTITITGQALDHATHVMVGPHHALILEARPTELVVRVPGTWDPGFHPVLVFAGSTFVTGRLEACPSMLVTPIYGDPPLPEAEDGCFARDGRLRLRLGNGGPGTWVFVASLRERPEPLRFPSIGYAFLLQEPLYLLNGGRIPDGGVLIKDFPYPPDLIGQRVFFQGWSTQSTPEGELQCFTNIREQTL